MTKKQNIPQGLPSETKAKKGYKKTKLGWIPEEWGLFQLREVCKKFINGGTPSTKIDKFWTGNIPWITGADIIEQKISGIRRHITNEAVENSSTNIIKKGNLLVVTRTGVGKLTIAPFDIAISQDLTGVYCNEDNLLTKYLFYFLDFTIPSLAQLNQGTSINGITRDSLTKHFIKLPPFPEQQKIAQILSAWDRAIEKYELLIRKYELRKKGLMQQLLSGKRRFQEFEGSEWKAVKLGDNTICFSGGTPSRSKKEYYNGEIPWIKSGELNNDKIYNTEEFITNEGLNNSSAKIVEEETILVALYGATAGVIAVTMVEAAINQAVLAILPSKIIDKYFLLYKLKFIMPHVVENMVQGGQPNLSGTIVKGVRLNIPVKKNEQQKIVSILSTADKEIEVLKQQLEKLKKQKKGLMQVLLTGKVRVTV